MEVKTQQKGRKARVLVMSVVTLKPIASGLLIV